MLLQLTSTLPEGKKFKAIEYNYFPALSSVDEFNSRQIWYFDTICSNIS